MSILLLILSLHIYVMIPSINYFFSSGNKDDSRTIVQAQSTATSLKTITKLNFFYFGLTTNENALINHNNSFNGIRIINTNFNPVKTDTHSYKDKSNHHTISKYQRDLF